VIPRAQELIDTLGLQPHPEGGWYRQIFKSEERVIRQRDDANRSALTTIYFLLAEGTYSAWHRVSSDEVWHFYEGDALALLTRDATITLDANHRVHVIRAGEWQAARPLGAYTLVGCTVGPGFEFEDFEMKAGPLDSVALLVRGPI
jgi:predicted cupin superfamily sugar epimerase